MRWGEETTARCKTLQRHWTLFKISKEIKQNTEKIHVKEIILSKVAGLQYANLPKIDRLHKYFSRMLPTFHEHPFWRKPMNDCFCDFNNFEYGVSISLLSFELISKSFKFSEYSLYIQNSPTPTGIKDSGLNLRSSV